MSDDPLRSIGVRDGTNMVDPAELSRADLLGLIANMQHDWVKLNEFLNGTAIRFRWCSDWEYRIAAYNESFKVLRLEGRRDQDIGNQPDNYLLPGLKRERVDRGREADLASRPTQSPMNPALPIPERPWEAPRTEVWGRSSGGSTPYTIDGVERMRRGGYIRTNPNAVRHMTPAQREQFEEIMRRNREAAMEREQELRHRHRRNPS